MCNRQFGHLFRRCRCDTKRAYQSHGITEYSQARLLVNCSLSTSPVTSPPASPKLIQKSECPALVIGHPGMIATLTIICVVIWAFSVCWAYAYCQVRIITKLWAQPQRDRDEWILNYCKHIGIDPDNEPGGC
jgi:hypothetical protein